MGIICVIYVLCLSCFCVCSLLPYGHLLENGRPLGSCLCCLIVVLCLSCFHVCSLQPCGHPLGKADLLVLVCVA